MSAKLIEIFVRGLRKHYPLDHDLTLGVTLSPGPIMRGERKLHGTSCVMSDFSSAEIAVNIDQVDILVLKTIAHEFRHVMQRVNFGWMGGNCQAYESDANRWAGPVAREFYYSNC